jgi:citrate lyase gamma subunit
MNPYDGPPDRRTVLRVGATWAVASLLGCRGGATAVPEQATYTSLRPARSRVVLIRRTDVLRADGSADPAALRAMLNDAVTSLLQTKSPAAAWQQLVKPTDIVGIKSNLWRSLPTPPALEEAIRAEVVAAGVQASNVAVDDRGIRDNPVFARATALINTRPMRTHAWSGLGSCLKNYIMFVPRPADHHDDACASLGSIWRQPSIEGKTRLNVLVMLTPQFHSLGPHSFSTQFVWPYGGLIVGTDVVAVDSVGARIIQAKRRLYFGDDRPISPPPHHIQIADTRYGLGNSDPAKIDLVRLGKAEDSLI